MESRGSSSKEQRPPSHISLQTLIIASIASAAASFAASRIWGSGTLVSAAATPVVVALVSEFLRRPVQTVAKTAQKVPTVQTLPLHRRTVPAPGDSTTTSKDDSGTTPHAETGAWHRWRLAVVTGVLAFAIVVAVFTVPDLLAGHSITGNGQPTTFFGAAPRSPHKSSSVTTVTSTSTASTVTKTTSATTTTKATTTTSSGTAPTTTTTATTATSTGTPATGTSETPTTTTSAP